MRNRQKYGIELEAEKLLRKLTWLVGYFGKFFFEIPKNKNDKMIYVLETLAWLSLTVVIVLRIFGR